MFAKNLPRIILGSSSVVASISSYALSVSLIYLFQDDVQYASYLSLNSWANYLSTFSYFSILELSISPASESYHPLNLLKLSLLFLVLFISITLLVLAASHRTIGVLPLAVFSFSLYRLTSNYLLYIGATTSIIILRYSRSFLILLAVGLSFSPYFSLQHYTSQVALQSLICLFLLPVPLFKAFSNRPLYHRDLLKPFNHDLPRLFKRNISLAIDTLHTPLLLTILSSSAPTISPVITYTIGLILPASSLASVILRERFLIKYSSTIDNIITSKFKHLYRAYLAALTLSCVLPLFLGSLIPLLLQLFLLVPLISFSGVTGLLFGRLGLEVADIKINIAVTSLLLLLILLSTITSSYIMLPFAISCVSFKYIFQYLIVFRPRISK